MAKSKFLTEVREFMRLHGYSIRTEHTYIYWIRFYIRFHRLQHPSTLGPEHVVMFLSFLANRRDVAINTQKVALNALAFLYNKYLNQPLGDIGFTFATRPRHLPTVLSSAEVGKLLDVCNERDRLIFSLLFGSGLRITECLRLRIKDFDFSKGTLTVFDGKGAKDRVTILPQSLKPVCDEFFEMAIACRRKITNVGLALHYLAHWVRSIHLRICNLHGCSFSHLRLYAAIPIPKYFAAIICTTLCLAKR